MIITEQIKKNKNKSSTGKMAKWPYIFIAPYLISFTAFFIYPTIFSFFISITDWDSLMGEANRQFVGLSNFIQLFTKDALFYKALANTFIFMIVYIPILILGGLGLAVMLYKLNSSRRFFQTVNILPYITTPVAIGVIFSFMFDWSTGIVNKILIEVGVISEGINWLGTPWTARIVVILMIIWKNMGYYLLIYLAGLSTVPKEIHEAAKVDGANSWQAFWQITFPFLKPITIFLVVTSVISGFQLFDEPYLLFSTAQAPIGGPERSCLTAMIYFFDKTFKSSTKLGYGAAISYGLFMVILLSSTLLNKVFFRKEKI